MKDNEDRYPQKGSNANGKDSNAKGSNNINTIEIQGRIYVIGEGEGPTSLQSKYKNIMLPMYLFALAASYSKQRVFNCDINCLLPILQVKSKKQELKNMLIGSHTFKFNGQINNKSI